MQLFESFFWGVIAALGALVVEVVFFIGTSFYMNPVSPVDFSRFFAVPGFIIMVALIEEIFKCLVIFKRLGAPEIRKAYFSNSLLIGLGFFGAELALIEAAGSLPEARFLAEIAIVHIGTAGLIGYMATDKNPRRSVTFLSAAGIAAVFHAIYNIFTSQRGPAENYAIFFLLGLLLLANTAIFFQTRLQSD